MYIFFYKQSTKETKKSVRENNIQIGVQNVINNVSAEGAVMKSAGKKKKTDANWVDDYKTVHLATMAWLLRL